MYNRGGPDSLFADVYGGARCDPEDNLERGFAAELIRMSARVEHQCKYIAFITAFESFERGNTFGSQLRRAYVRFANGDDCLHFGSHGGLLPAARENLQIVVEENTGREDEADCCPAVGRRFASECLPEFRTFLLCPG